ncbi:MarR family transcriptional regulator [Cronobacter turicensis]|uniref:MarR family transcriptional regulator n=1 Tax=Cronobacter turicensis TaxID=413502 RepID=UPI0024A9CB13|nr:MarR family transcriptional regulator [Cronobacter turicensis]EKM0436839.1 MarR family transcriptional regulator [Cronobacter turicensis]ELY4321093.1 MarR family transcriptional regulator [Cronobacter turicensis]ELY5942070.1 MarR family transcriptional regulator [Cronobacter turicensis]ELY5962160.1 MarR family transcriptional regulator [Cronobacter turicensis]MDI6418715.1 MarR family transcriptional regulator [Cronobacter turicensis]
MKITNTELNVLKVMAEKETDWTWIMLDRTLAIRGIEGFSNVANIVTCLVDNGMVDAVYTENALKPRYRVSPQGHQLLREKDDH